MLEYSSQVDEGNDQELYSQIETGEELVDEFVQMLGGENFPAFEKQIYKVSQK